MDKPAQIILKFDKKTDSFWREFVTTAKTAVVNEVGDTVLAVLAVENFSLTDHQFVQVKMKLKQNDRELVVHFPRNIVLMIVEGKGRPGDAGFFPSKVTTATKP